MLCRPVFPPLEKGAKNTPKNTSSETNKKKKRPDHTKRGNSNVLTQGSFIRVLTVWVEIFYVPTSSFHMGGCPATTENGRGKRWIRQSSAGGLVYKGDEGKVFGERDAKNNVRDCFYPCQNFPSLSNEPCDIFLFLSTSGCLCGVWLFPSYLLRFFLPFHPPL